MKAVGFDTPGPIDAAASLVDFEMPQPMAMGHDLLVAVRAVSVNPVDAKVRNRFQPEAGMKKVLGYDAAGDLTAHHLHHVVG